MSNTVPMIHDRMQPQAATSEKEEKFLITWTTTSFTFMLPCIVRDFFLNNKPDALIIQFILL